MPEVDANIRPQRPVSDEHFVVVLKGAHVLDMLAARWGWGWGWVPLLLPSRPTITGSVESVVSRRVLWNRAATAVCSWYIGRMVLHHHRLVWSGTTPVTHLVGWASPSSPPPSVFAAPPLLSPPLWLRPVDELKY